MPAVLGYRLVWRSCNRSRKKDEKRQKRLKRAQDATLVRDGCRAGGSDNAGREATMMLVRGVAFVLGGLLLGGCMQSVPVSDANFTARDKRQLANAPYQQAWIAPDYQRQVVPY